MADWYSWHWVRATDDLRRWKLVYLAEADYARYRGIDRRRLIANQKSVELPDGFESEKEAMTRIVEWYRGWDVLEVTVYEHCSPGFVKKARRVHRRSEHSGIERTGWRGWSDEERHTAIKKAMLRAGRSLHKVSGELGVSERTLSPYWRRVCTELSGEGRRAA